MRLKRDGLDEKLEEDIPPAGADGHADADFARALGDADEHDVHDADAADQQRNAGDAADSKVIVLELAVAISAISCWLRTVKSSSLPATMWWRWRSSSMICCCDELSNLALADLDDDRTAAWSRCAAASWRWCKG